MRNSINVRLTAIMLAVMLIPLISISIFWGIKYSGVSLQTIYMNQFMLNQSDASTVQNFLDSRFNSLSALSFEFAKANQINPDILNQIKQQLANDTYIDQIGITDSAGQEILLVDSNMNNLALKNVYNTEAFKNTNKNYQNTYAGSIEYINSKPSVTLAVPINSTDNSVSLTDHLNNSIGNVLISGNPKGMIFYSLNIQSLLKSVLNPSYGMNMQGMKTVNFGEPVANQYSYIVNPSGVVIASYDSTMVGKDLSNLGIIKEYINGIKNTTNSNYDSQNLSNSGYFNNYKNINSYTNYTTLSGYGNWGVVTETPKSSVYSSIVRFALFNTLLVLIAAMLIIIIANYASKLITSPIKILLQAMDQIGGGNYDIDLNTERKDEFGKLNTSVVNLSQSIKTLLTTTNEQSGELQAIIDNNRSPILSLDNSGGILISNKPARALLELTEINIHGKKVEEILPLKVGEVKTNMNLDGLLDGKYFLENQIFMSPTKQKHIVDISITKLPKSDLIITRYVLTFTDKTKSIELDEMKLDFVSMAAHELRTPLTAIQGYLELMLFGDNANGYNDSTRRYIDQARVSSKELSELITKLLNVSRIEHGNLKFSWDKVDIAERVKEAVESLQFNAKEKKVTLSLKGNVENEFIVADRYSIQEVIDNLIDNAIKYNKENGEVNVSIEDDGSNYTIIIADTGIGVPKNAIHYLFTKFYRVHGGLESGSTGTGLGLYLAKQIIESHRGTISVESEINKGTTFTITLPHYSETLIKTLSGTDNIKSKEANNAWNTKNINR